MNEIIRLRDFRELYKIVSHQQESTAANDDSWIVVGFQDNFYSVHLLQGKVLLYPLRKMLSGLSGLRLSISVRTILKSE